jgi:hypothetical protein
MDISGEMLSLIGAGLTAAVAIVAILMQHAGSRRALTAQEDVARKFREHERRLTLDQRIWDRRIDLYTRITHTMRDHLHSPLTEVMESPKFASLISEADLLASPQTRDTLNRYVYDNADTQKRIDLWGEFVNVVRAELEIPAVTEEQLRDWKASVGDTGPGFSIAQE